MSTRIEVILPDDVYRTVERLSQLTNRAPSDVLVDTLAVALPTVDVNIQDIEPVANLSDDALLALTEMQLPPQADQRLSDLLYAQQMTTLSDAERAELDTLMQRYRLLLLRKAQALTEAVARGLREPLEA